VSAVERDIIAGGAGSRAARRARRRARREQPAGVPVPPAPASAHPLERQLERVAAEVVRAIGSSRAVIGVTSAREQDDPLPHALALARVLRRHRDGDVLVIEASLRRPSRSRELLGVLPRPGLVDALRKPGAFARAVHATDEPGIAIVPSGARTERLFIGAAAFGLVIEHARAHAPLVIVASPPLDEGGDGDLVSRACDQLLLVVERDATPRDAIGEAVARAGRERFLGAIMIARGGRLRRRGRRG